AENASWRSEAMRLFEVGKVFLPQADQPLPREEWRLAALVTGEERKGWDWPGYSLDFFYLKGVLAAFLDHWGLGNGVSLRAEAALPALHPGRQARVRLGEREVGWIGELHPEVREDYGLPERASLLELDLETLWSLAAGVTRTYQPWARYPAVARDIAVVVPRELSHETVVRSIMRAGGELLREVRLFDLYQGEPVPAGYKSLA
ncbi:MAG: phenylalanine--tRNA ligase subunit beta, partial [Clostridia bacterium]|nr:phenylalanine--tRNA ligase subunit beta [Clostridia bacterium]